MNRAVELDASALRSVCDPSLLPFADTREIEPLDQVIGQERAVRAIDFGLNMASPGYHIFVTGSEGTGKSSIVAHIVRRHAETLPVPFDWCMVNNFLDEYCPCVLKLPPGKGSAFSKSIQHLIENIRRDIPKILQGKSYQDRVARIRKKYGEQQRFLFEKLEEEASGKQLAVVSDENGTHAVPMDNDKPMTQEDFQRLPKKKRIQIENDVLDIQERIEASLREINRITEVTSEKIQKATEDVTRLLVSERDKQIRAEYRDHEGINRFLDDILNDILEHIDQFEPPDISEDSVDGGTNQDESFFTRYRVNVLVDHHEGVGAPVIFEANPTYPNVIGRMEKRSRQGASYTDFSMVLAGSLLKADGGFLIMEMEPLLQNPFVWDALKRTLQNRMLAIEEMNTDLGYASATLRPQQIPVDVKVILLGSYELFETIQHIDSKFSKIFRVRADFDDEVAANPEVMIQYARFIARLCRDESLLPFTANAVAGVIEYGKTLVSHQKKLSLRFGPIVGLAKEADYWARKENRAVVDENSIDKAQQEYRFRNNLYEQKVHESYIDHTVLIDVSGDRIGQVNGLSVYQIGEITFGRPSRITAEVYMGKPGVIHIERESGLSGKTHDKGVLVLSGYLGGVVAGAYPVSFTASITFEQNYGEIDGDSASSAELYAVMSCLSGIPIRQDIAVTGSINQKGEVQPIGGVNEKVEGFFDVCRAKGFTGMQGVIIPQANVDHLMLRKDVVLAVREGNFHIYPITTIREGIEVLTGFPAGSPDSNGVYPTESMLGKMQAKNREYVERYYSLSIKPEARDASFFSVL